MSSIIITVLLLGVSSVCSFASIPHDVVVAPPSIIRQTQKTKKCFFRYIAMSSASGDDDVVHSGDNHNAPTEFTRAEINQMETLIDSLSREADDGIRRKRLADMLDVELAADASNAESFTKLFQLSLDNIGERVQATARELAIEKQQQEELQLADVYDAGNAGNPIEDDVVVRREKSEEELQLWALIDMMVQSKTRIKSSIRNNTMS
jgi:hypothetical protein